MNMRSMKVQRRSVSRKNQNKKAWKLQIVAFYLLDDSDVGVFENVNGVIGELFL